MEPIKKPRGRPRLGVRKIYVTLDPQTIEDATKLSPTRNVSDGIRLKFKSETVADDIELPELPERVAFPKS